MRGTDSISQARFHALGMQAANLLDADAIKALDV